MRQSSMAPALRQIQQYLPNAAVQTAFRDVLYDFTTYAQAGQTQLSFFQNPVGNSGKTYADTNMTNNGMLPAPQYFYVTGISCYFYPGVLPSIFGAEAVAAGVNDVWNYATGGFLKFTIGTKDWVVAPLIRFPSTCGLSVSAALADASTVAGAQQSRIAYASVGGEPFSIDPGVVIPATQNFNVTMNWPVAVGVSAAARVGVMLDGIRYTLAQ